MARTPLLDPSVMNVKPQGAIQGPNWTQIPGSASQITAAPDGSIWALSDQPAGPDKYIWHYANGSWANISGLAAHLAAAPDGTLYAVNSGGGTYAYSGGSWSALGGGASAITAASDGSVYVLSNGGAVADKGIWHNVNGTWSQVPGSGVAIAASWDVGGPYAGSPGSIRPGGLYILNSAGAIWYENADGTFAQLPGNASMIVPAQNSGVFALGFPTNTNGNSIYYYDLRSPGWTAQPGAAIGIAADTNLYAVSASGAIYSTPVQAQASSLPVRGLWVQFERRGSGAEYWPGQVIQQLNDFDSVINSTVRSEVALELDKMRTMGVNTIVLELRTADPSGSGFTPPTCYEPSVLGFQYPQPTATELSNLTAFFDLVYSKGIKIVLRTTNTHMEEQPPNNNTTWLNAILQTIKNHPAFYLATFDGDVHVNNFNGTLSCGTPAEPPLWLGLSAQPAQYVKWAIGYANSLGIPFSKLSAEAIVGDYNVTLSPNLRQPVVVLKQVFDSLGVPDAQRTYALSFYEHTKCYDVQGTCADEDPNTWADETMQFIFSTIGRNGAHAVAVEYGDLPPVSSSWPTVSATDSLLTLMEKYGMDGGCFWRWISFNNSEDADPTLADPVKRRGVAFTYNPVEAVLAKHYTSP